MTSEGFPLGFVSSKCDNPAFRTTSNAYGNYYKKWYIIDEFYSKLMTNLSILQFWCILSHFLSMILPASSLLSFISLSTGI